jgi:hypothetical protein
VDEIDSLFFTQHTIETHTSVSLSPLILLNKYKLIGMTATFRGDQGKAKMLSFLYDSNVIKTVEVNTERDITKLEVFGRMKSVAAVEQKAMELAKIKAAEIPVIIILPTIDDCDRLAP